MNHDSDRNPSANGDLTEPSSEAARIAAELAALGEPELDALELEALGASVKDAQAHDWASEDRSFVEMLDAFAAPVDGEPELDELAQRRVWAKFSERSGHDGGGRRVIAWGVLLAAAAAVALFVWDPASRGASQDDGQAAMVALRTQAHAGLEALGVDTSAGADAARVRALLDAPEGQG